MQEIQDRIFLLGIGLVAVRGVDRQAAGVSEDLAVIPRVADGSVLSGFTIVLGPLAGNDEHRKIAGAVALDINVLRVVHGHAVHYEVIRVDLRLGKRNLHLPDVVLTALHIDGAAVGVGHPGAAELDDGGIVGLQAEGDAVVLDFGRDDGALAASEVEVGQFLGVERSGYREARCNKGKDSFHYDVVLVSFRKDTDSARICQTEWPIR